MGKLSGAYGSSTTYAKTELTIDEEGDYAAYFIGFSKPWTETSSTYPCKLCKGEGTGPRGEPEGCVRCNGSGKNVEQKTKLRYQMQHGIEEEVVSFKLSAPGTLNGKATKASTMYLRFRSLAEMPQATAEQLDAWYSSLPDPVRIPCMVRVQYNEAGTALIIASVKVRKASAGAAAPPKPAPVQEPQHDEYSEAAAYDFDDREIPFSP